MIDVRAVGIGALALIECVAMATHTDGIFFSLVVMAIAGISGFTIGEWHCISRGSKK